jgi:hypothetical protein
VATEPISKFGAGAPVDFLAVCLGVFGAVAVFFGVFEAVVASFGAVASFERELAAFKRELERGSVTALVGAALGIVVEIYDAEHDSHQSSNFRPSLAGSNKIHT